MDAQGLTCTACCGLISMITNHLADLQAVLDKSAKSSQMHTSPERATRHCATALGKEGAAKTITDRHACTYITCRPCDTNKQAAFLTHACSESTRRPPCHNWWPQHLHRRLGLSRPIDSRPDRPEINKLSLIMVQVQLQP